MLACLVSSLLFFRLKIRLINNTRAITHNSYRHDSLSFGENFFCPEKSLPSSSSFPQKPPAENSTTEHGVHTVSKLFSSLSPLFQIFIAISRYASSICTCDLRREVTMEDDSCSIMKDRSERGCKNRPKTHPTRSWG